MQVQNMQGLSPPICLYFLSNFSTICFSLVMFLLLGPSKPLNLNKAKAGKELNRFN